MQETIVVLGATGKTGRRVCAHLEEHRFRPASRTPRRDFVAFDWTIEATWADALRGATSVYVIAPDVADPTPMTTPFLARARAAGVRKIVLLSSLGVTFPEEPADSGRARLEASVRDSGMAWTILRPSGFDQNFSEGFLLPGIVHQGAVVSSTADGRVAFVDADDIAAVAVAALTDDAWAGQTLALTGPEALSFADAAAIIGRACGRAIEHRAITSAQFEQILLGVGASAEYAAVPVRDQRAIRAGHGAHVSDDVVRVTGRPPRSFEAFATAAAPAWRVPATAG